MRLSAEASSVVCKGLCGCVHKGEPMTDRERSETGQFDDRVPLERVRDVFAGLEDSAEPLDAGEVADESGIARRTAHNKLNSLVDEGELRTKKVGARGRVWWVPHMSAEGDEPPERPQLPADEDQRRDDPPAEPTLEDASTADEGDETHTDNEAGGMADETEGDLASAVRDHMEDADLPPKTAHGRDAVIDVFRVLRERGTLSTGKIQSEVYPGYEDHWAGPRAMWNGIDRYLDDIPGIEKGGYGEWTYSGDDAVLKAIRESGD